MAGLVHRAYQGCLQERRPISHSSCFDVRYRGPPVPLHALRHAQPFELTVCGKAAAAPRRVAPPPPRLPNQFWRLRIWSLLAVGSTRLVCQKKGFDVSWHEEEEVGGGGPTNRRIDRCVALLSECR